ncbi:hypothetical protein SARC_07004 [Sphaeroforma arctica JP610]|uniref:Uncharacterized protein n=1 Tax=Sphaeroforma arctica JP610 TaxID=667725 RepID=A0A0L0FUW8_9EUKA|nr:hypothetical protein SARC_07004 [Sphaeroforma arctica JP610]KNC80640.1 hypothetical protein SARC_07004 [Sphaeroforma arctica JP610]|eukprot:XP_014154542.1 hypothetical protein SARC_07004 [Sphaeroforma arctica JP610]
METADPAFTNGQLARISQALLEGVVGGMVADLDDATCYMGFSLLQYFEDAQKLRQATLEALDILVQSRFVTVEWKSGHTQAREGLSKSPNILPNTAAIPIVGGDRITRTNMSMKSNEETNPPAQPYISMQVYATGGEGMSLQSTHLGRACVASALAPGESHLVFKDLDNATKALALETELQLCYLVAPPYNMYSTEQQHNKWQALVTALGVPNNQVYLRVLHNIGINPDSLIRWSQRGESAAEKRDPSEELARARRLYIAYAMSMIVKEEPIANISRLPARLSFGVTQELYKLTSIPGINGADARALYNHGYKDLRDIASARPKAIADVLWNAKPFRTDSSVSETQVQRLPKHIENEKKRLLVRAGQMQKAANQHFAAELEIISQPNGPRDKTPTPLRMESSLQSRTSWIKPTPVQRQLPGATPSNNRSGVGKSETGVSENRNTAPKQRAEFTPPFPSMRSRTITPAQTPALSWARAQQLTQPHTQALTKSHVQTHTHRHVQIQTPVRRREEGYSNLKQQVNTQSSENTPIQWIGQRTPMGTQTPASMQSLTQRHVQAQTPMYSKPWVKGLSPDTDDHENSTMSLRTQATNVQHMHEHPTQYTQHAPTQHTHTRHTHPPPPVYQVQHGTKRSIGDTQRLDDIGSVGASGNYGTELDHRILDGHTRKRSKVDHSEQVSDPHTMAEHGLNLETTSNLLEEHRGYHGMDGVVETLSKQQQPQIQQHIHLGEQPVPYEKQHTVSRETQQERQRALSQQGQSNSNQQESRLEQHNLEGRPQPLPSGHRQEQKGKDGEQLRQQNLDVQHQSQIGMQHQQKCSSSMLPQSKHNSMKHQQTNHSIQNQQNNYCMPHQQSRQPYEQQHQQQQRQQQTRANPEHQEMSTLQLNHQAQLQRAKKQREKEARLQLQRQRKIEQQRYNLASMAQQNAPENLASTATVENSTRPSKSLNPSKDSARDATRSAAATSTGMDRAGATHANVAIETRSGHPRIAEFDKKEASMSTIVHNNANSSSGVVVKESGGTLNDAQKTQESGAKRVATANATAVVAKQHVEKKPSSGSEAVMRVVMVVQVMTSDASFREFERTWRSKSKFCIW